MAEEAYDSGRMFAIVRVDQYIDLSLEYEDYQTLGIGETSSRQCWIGDEEQAANNVVDTDLITDNLTKA